MSTTPTAVINARVQPQHAQQLRQIADRNASTVSRTVARIIARALDSQQTATSTPLVATQLSETQPPG